MEFNTDPNHIAMLAMNYDPFPVLQAMNSQGAAQAPSPVGAGAMGPDLAAPSYSNMLSPGPAEAKKAAAINPKDMLAIQQMMQPQRQAMGAPGLPGRPGQVQVAPLAPPKPPLGSVPTLSAILGRG